MSRQSQDLYTSVRTAHNKIDKLDKRISKLEGDGEDNAEVIQDHQLRLTDMETLHYKGVYPEAHNYPEPVHNEPKHTCSTCTHALSLDKYDDILCLRASVWQHPRFESPDTTDCDHHHERETQ